MNTIYEDTWASLTVWMKNLMVRFPEAGYIDWEAHGVTPELPNQDLYGPLAIALSETEQDLYEINFSVGVSTYEGDTGLFRLRSMVGKFFNEMKSQSRIEYFDTTSTMVSSVLVMTPGTRIHPMTSAQIRPFQYIQGTALLVPQDALS